MRDLRWDHTMDKGDNHSQVGPNGTLQCPNTVSRHGGRFVCAKPFGKMNGHGRAEIRVLDRLSAGLLRPAFTHICRNCKALLEITVLPLEEPGVPSTKAHQTR